MIIKFLNPDEVAKYSKIIDYELNQLFQEVRARYKRIHLLHEHEHIVKRKFWFDSSELVYTLFTSMGNGTWQVIHFKLDNGLSYTCVAKSYIMAYFYGLINGMDDTQKQTHPVQTQTPQMN